jgi:hypothetical protein
MFSVIREIKKLGGLDTVGIEHGDGIAKRLRSEFYQHVPHFMDKERLDQLLASFPLDVNDADCPWWTSMTSTERTVEQQERVTEFLTFCRYCEAKLPVFVGHSLFFKAFYSRRISNELLLNRQSLSENLKKFRLSNASMLAVTVKFLDRDNGLSEAMIIDSDLIFGGGFHDEQAGLDGGHHHHHHHHEGHDDCDDLIHHGYQHNSKDGHEGGGSHHQHQHLTAGSRGGSFFGDSPIKFPSSLENNNNSGSTVHSIFNSMKPENISKGVKKLSDKIMDIFEMN